MSDTASRYPAITLDTIGKLIDYGQSAFFWCPACEATRDIDLHRVADKFGRDWPLGRRWPVKCRCGERNVQIRLQRAPHDWRPTPGFKEPH